MNIEGAERGALAGLQLHADKIRHVAISCHDFVADAGGGNQFRTKKFVRNRLVELGFAIQEHTDAKTTWGMDVVFGNRSAN
ncbi:MAG: hypothetical protein ABIN83_03225, partial [Sphingomicrobium sp.]